MFKIFMIIATQTSVTFSKGRSEQEKYSFHSKRHALNIKMILEKSFTKSATDCGIFSAFENAEEKQ